MSYSKFPDLSDDGLRARVESDDGESLVREDAVAEAVDAVPVGAAVPDLGPDSIETNVPSVLVLKPLEIPF